MTNIKLIAVDMDGTFLNDEKKFDRERFAKIKQELDRRGIKFAAASGNQQYRLQQVFSDFGDMYFIGSNGAYIGHNENPVIVNSFNDDATKKIMKTLDPITDLKFVYSGDKSGYYRNSNGEEFFQSVSRFYGKLVGVDDFMNIDDKLLMVSLFPDNKNTTYYIKVLNEQLNGAGEVISSGFGFIDIIQKGQNKARALKQLGEKLNISLDEMASFGDGGNDIEMLRETGMGVAMKNAAPEVIEVANHITEKDNNHSGVLDFIEQNIL